MNIFPIPWYAILLITFPQIILIIKLGFELFGLKLDIKTVILVTCITSVITYFLRKSNIIPGLHTIILILIMAFLVTFFARVKIWNSLIASLLGFMILGVIEGLWLPVFLFFTSRNVEELLLHPWLNIIGFQFIILIAVFIYLMVRKYNLVIFKLDNGGFY